MNELNEYPGCTVVQLYKLKFGSVDFISPEIHITPKISSGFYKLVIMRI